MIGHQYFTTLTKYNILHFCIMAYIWVGGSGSTLGKA